MVKYLMGSTNMVPCRKNSELHRKVVGGIGISVLYMQIVVIIKPLIIVTQCGFLDLSIRIIEWNCFPHLVFYCCNIPKGKHLSWIGHVTSVEIPCVGYYSTLDDLRTIWLSILYLWKKTGNSFSIFPLLLYKQIPYVPREIFLKEDSVQKKQRYS